MNADIAKEIMKYLRCCCIQSLKLTNKFYFEVFLDEKFWINYTSRHYDPRNYSFNDWSESTRDSLIKKCENLFWTNKPTTNWHFLNKVLANIKLVGFGEFGNSSQRLAINKNVSFRDLGLILGWGIHILYGKKRDWVAIIKREDDAVIDINMETTLLFKDNNNVITEHFVSVDCVLPECYVDIRSKLTIFDTITDIKTVYNNWSSYEEPQYSVLFKINHFLKGELENDDFLSGGVVYS
jgi:hypothetical protein